MQGLYKRQNSKYWWIKKTYQGVVIQGSTGETNRRRAEEVLLAKMEEVANAKLHGVRTPRYFEEAAERYWAEKKYDKSAQTTQYHLNLLMPFLEHTPLSDINNQALDAFRTHRLEVDKVRPVTVQRTLEILRALLNCAATLWYDDATGKTWIEHAPKILMPSGRVKNHTSDKPYPLSSDELTRIMNILRRKSQFQRDVCVFTYHTGLRGGEAINLRWEWEEQYDGLDRPVLFIPGEKTKNGEDRIVALSDTAHMILEYYRAFRTDDNPWVFAAPQSGKPMTQLNTHQWQNAWAEAGLPTEGFVCGPHQLRHTLTNRMQAIGAPEYIIKTFMGHADRSITDHYNSAEVNTLVETVNRAVTHKSTVIFRKNRSKNNRLRA
jgi:integrase